MSFLSLSLSLFISPSSSLSFPGHPSSQSGGRAEMNYGRIRSPVLSKAFSLNPPVQPAWAHICGHSSASACPHLCVWAWFVFTFSTFRALTSSQFWFVIIRRYPVLFLPSYLPHPSSSLYHADASWKAWKSCSIDPKGKVIDPAEFAWEYILFEPRDHNRSAGITPVSAPLAFQRLRWKLICLFITFSSCN